MVLYNGMASTSPWAALYFVALMTFGNYVLFNLLVAILVEGFQAEVRRIYETKHISLPIMERDSLFLNSQQRESKHFLCGHLCVFQGDANRSESDDEKKSDNFEEDEKVEQLRDTGKRRKTTTKKTRDGSIQFVL